jgi:4-hydroxythreonine-4-phosphate dehydrogenase
MEDYKIKVGITQGDINGIGYEIIIKTLADNRVLDFCVPVIYGSSKVAAFHRKSIEAPSFNLNVINNASEINTKRINIINCVDEEIKVELSKSTSIGGEAAIASLERATKDLKNGLIDVLVTAPINRKNISSELFNFQGHTEYLEHQFGQQGDALMLLVSDVMRIAIVTGHLPLKKVPEILTEKIIIDKLQTLVKTLTQDFAIRKPRIAVLG